MATEDIFLERIADIVYVQKRPFSYIDFLFFEYEGKEYRFKHESIRNIFSRLRKKGQIELAYKSTPAYHTIPGFKFGKSVTPNHGGEDSLNFKQNELLHLIQTVPMDVEGIHDIRWRFEAKGLWSTLPLYSDSENLIENIDIKNNKDITLQDIDLKDFTLKTTVHRTDTVSVMAACSESPVPLNLEGFAKLTSGITRVEERLQRVVDEHIKLNLNSRKLSSLSLITKSAIPNQMSWIVTMWHFGRDSLTEYTGERFEISWGDGLRMFRIYSKQFKSKKKMKIRQETQENPNKPHGDAFMDKMKKVADKDEEGVA